MNKGSNAMLNRLDALGLLRGGSALDLGAGSGNDSLFLKAKGYEVTSVDKDAPVRADAFSGVSFIQSDIKDFDFEKVKYDLVVANNVLPFFSDSELFPLLEKIAASIKKDGLFCFSLFGKEDEWFGRKGMNFEAYDEAVSVIGSLPFEIIFESTEKGLGTTMKGGQKFWQIHRFIVRKK